MSELRPDHKRLAVRSESPGQITAKLGRHRTQERKGGPPAFAPRFPSLLRIRGELRAGIKEGPVKNKTDQRSTERAPGGLV